jgi:ribosomal protein L19
LDPKGTRTRLFALDNPDAIQVRDIVLVRQKTGDPFAGVVMRIKRAAQNTGILLRNTVTGTGVEMDFKIYSPNVTGIEVVQRRPKKPKQHRLYYLRYVELLYDQSSRMLTMILQRSKARYRLSGQYCTPISSVQDCSDWWQNCIASRLEAATEDEDPEEETVDRITLLHLAFTNVVPKYPRAWQLPNMYTNNVKYKN